MPGCLAQPSPGLAARRDGDSAQPRCCGTDPRDLSCPAMRHGAIQVTGGDPRCVACLLTGGSAAAAGGF